MTDDLEDYIAGHIDPEGDYLHRLWRDTQLRLSYGQMASGHLQGRLLKMHIEMTKPLKVLELGTFSGYATLCMAEGLPDGAELHTFEIFDENEDFLPVGQAIWYLPETIEVAPYSDVVVAINGAIDHVNNPTNPSDAKVSQAFDLSNADIAM